MTERLWLVFFGDTPRRAWWANFLRPGFRHVWAVSWFAEQQRWVYVDPARDRTVVQLFGPDEGGALLDRCLASSMAVLRVASRRDRISAPPCAWCTGQMKALLGIRSAALTPWQLYGALLRRGAEVAFSTRTEPPQGPATHQGRSVAALPMSEIEYSR